VGDNVLDGLLVREGVVQREGCHHLRFSEPPAGNDAGVLLHAGDDCTLRRVGNETRPVVEGMKDVYLTKAPAGVITVT
jgi:hypothetical protein